METGAQASSEEPQVTCKVPSCPGNPACTNRQASNNSAMRPGSLSTKLNVHLRETELVGKIVGEFGQWHDVPEQTVFVVKLSLDELVTNIVVHSAGQIPTVREIVLRLTTNQHE